MDAVWLVVWLAVEALRHGVQICGSPGSGKSLLLQAFRGSIAKLISRKPLYDIQIVDFDAKGDLYGIHGAFPAFVPIYDLNPFVNADVFDVMGEIDDPRDIAEIVALMIDRKANESQAFFPEAARIVLRRAVLRHWLEVPGATTFADVVLSGYDLDAIRLVAASHDICRGSLALVNDTEAGLSVAATLMAEMGKFEQIAGLYRTNARGRKVSTKSVLKDRFSVTRLPYDDKSVESLAPLTRLFTSRIQQRALAENKKSRHTLFVFDELALIPDGLNLALAAVKGREAGLDLVLAYQSPTMARTVFGRDRFDAVTSTPKTFICLNLPARDDAEWASKRFADYEAFVTTYSASNPGFGGALKGGSSTSGWSESFQTLSNITPGMIQGLGVPAPGNPVIEGFMATLPFKPFRFRIDIGTMLDEFIPKVPPKAPPTPRAARDMVLNVWQEPDLIRLRLV